MNSTERPANLAHMNVIDLSLLRYTKHSRTYFKQISCRYNGIFFVAD